MKKYLNSLLTLAGVNAGCSTSDYSSVIGGADYSVQHLQASVSSFYDMAVAGTIATKQSDYAFIYLVEGHQTCRVLWNYQFDSTQILINDQTGGFRAIEIRDEENDKVPNVLAVAYAQTTEEVVLQFNYEGSILQALSLTIPENQFLISSQIQRLAFSPDLFLVGPDQIRKVDLDAFDHFQVTYRNVIGADLNESGLVVATQLPSRTLTGPVSIQQVSADLSTVSSGHSVSHYSVEGGEIKIQMRSFQRDDDTQVYLCASTQTSGSLYLDLFSLTDGLLASYESKGTDDETQECLGASYSKKDSDVALFLIRKSTGDLEFIHLNFKDSDVRSFKSLYRVKTIRSSALLKDEDFAYLYGTTNELFAEQGELENDVGFLSNLITRSTPLFDDHSSNDLLIKLNLTSEVSKEGHKLFISALEYREIANSPLQRQLMFNKPFRFDKNGWVRNTCGTEVKEKVLTAACTTQSCDETLSFEFSEPEASCYQSEYSQVMTDTFFGGNQPLTEQDNTFSFKQPIPRSQMGKTTIYHLSKYTDTGNLGFSGFIAGSTAFVLQKEISTQQIKLGQKWSEGVPLLQSLSEPERLKLDYQVDYSTCLTVDRHGRQTTVGADCAPFLDFSLDDFSFTLSDNYNDIMALQKNQKKKDLFQLLRNSLNFPLDIHYQVQLVSNHTKVTLLDGKMHSEHSISFFNVLLHLKLTDEEVVDLSTPIHIDKAWTPYYVENYGMSPHKMTPPTDDQIEESIFYNEVDETHFDTLDYGEGIEEGDYIIVYEGLPKSLETVWSKQMIRQNRAEALERWEASQSERDPITADIKLEDGEILITFDQEVDFPSYMLEVYSQPSGRRLNDFLKQINSILRDQEQESGDLLSESWQDIKQPVVSELQKSVNTEDFDKIQFECPQDTIWNYFAKECVELQVPKPDNVKPKPIVLLQTYFGFLRELVHVELVDLAFTNSTGFQSEITEVSRSQIKIMTNLKDLYEYLSPTDEVKVELELAAFETRFSGEVLLTQKIGRVYEGDQIGIGMIVSTITCLIWILSIIVTICSVGNVLPQILMLQTLQFGVHATLSFNQTPQNAFQFAYELLGFATLKIPFLKLTEGLFQSETDPFIAYYKASLVEFPIVAGATVLTLVVVLVLSLILSRVSLFAQKVFVTLQEGLMWRIPVRLIQICSLQIMIAATICFKEQMWLVIGLLSPIAILLIYNVYAVIKYREDLNELEDTSLFEGFYLDGLETSDQVMAALEPLITILRKAAVAVCLRYTSQLTGTFIWSQISLSLLTCAHMIKFKPYQMVKRERRLYLANELVLITLLLSLMTVQMTFNSQEPSEEVPSPLYAERLNQNALSWFFVMVWTIQLIGNSAWQVYQTVLKYHLITSRRLMIQKARSGAVAPIGDTSAMSDQLQLNKRRNLSLVDAGDKSCDNMIARQLEPIDENEEISQQIASHSDGRVPSQHVNELLDGDDEISPLKKNSARAEARAEQRRHQNRIEVFGLQHAANEYSFSASPDAPAHEIVVKQVASPVVNEACIPKFNINVDGSQLASIEQSVGSHLHYQNTVIEHPVKNEQVSAISPDQTSQQMSFDTNQMKSFQSAAFFQSNFQRNSLVVKSFDSTEHNVKYSQANDIENSGVYHNQASNIQSLQYDVSADVSNDQVPVKLSDRSENVETSHRPMNAQITDQSIHSSPEKNLSRLVSPNFYESPLVKTKNMTRQTISRGTLNNPISSRNPTRYTMSSKEESRMMSHISVSAEKADRTSMGLNETVGIGSRQSSKTSEKPRNNCEVFAQLKEDDVTDTKDFMMAYINQYGK